MDGAQALAIPTAYGQSLQVEYLPSFKPELHWKSYDVNGNTWIDTRFEFWHFNCLDENPSEESLKLQKVLRQVRKQNSHFLRDEGDVRVETRLDFPLDWGLGSSSTLIYNISQWAYVSPFELLFSTYGGSGYDIACAQSNGSILYEKKIKGPLWSLVDFDLSFKDCLYFVFLGEKSNTERAIGSYNKRRPFAQKLIKEISHISQDMIQAKNIEEFNSLIKAHEKLVSSSLDLVPVKQQFFPDYWGEIKSLGAWGGDFIMVTSQQKVSETRQYFEKLGYHNIIPFKEMIYSPNKSI